MSRRSLTLLSLVFGLFVVGACDGTFSGLDDDATAPTRGEAAVVIGEPVCTTVNFDDFAHGDELTSAMVLGVNLTFTGLRYDGGTPQPTAYDVELTGADLAALNSTHDDTQAERNCTDCIGHGRILVVPDENFAVGGDNTEGGEIMISGFAADLDGIWSIEAFDAVDGDPTQGFTKLWVDGVETASNTRTGDATVETVNVPMNTITDNINFTIGSPAEDASSGIDNLVMCRAEEEEGDEGCTPGYWKQEHHFDSWVGYAPTDMYDVVFGVGPSITLLAALESKGGGESAFLRHSVAALLNASSSVAYGMSTAEVIALVQDTYASGEFEDAKNTLEELNERYCPLN
jgi:hypothetical protein